MMKKTSITEEMSAVYVVFVSLSGVYLLRPAVTFQITAVYQLHPRLLRVGVLVSSRGQLPDITTMYQATGDERAALV